MIKNIFRSEITMQSKFGAIMIDASVGSVQLRYTKHKIASQRKTRHGPKFQDSLNDPTYRDIEIYQYSMCRHKSPVLCHLRVSVREENHQAYNCARSSSYVFLITSLLSLSAAVTRPDSGAHGSGISLTLAGVSNFSSRACFAAWSTENGCQYWKLLSQQDAGFA